MHLVALGSTQPLTKMRNFLGGKVRPAQRTDNSAILVVSNVKVRMEAQHYIFPHGLHDLLQASFTFYT